MHISIPAGRLRRTPFGYGLSFTTFQYSNLRVSPSVLRNPGSITVSAEVTNTGAMEADEITQFYIHQDTARVSRPVRELKGFRRLHLKPRQKATVQFSLTPAMLSFYNSRRQRAIEPGKFHVWIAPDSASGAVGEFTLR